MAKRKKLSLRHRLAISEGVKKAWRDGKYHALTEKREATRHKKAAIKALEKLLSRLTERREHLLAEKAYKERP